MKSEVLIKIFSGRKTYDFYPDTFERDKLKIGSSIDCDIWVPELNEKQYLLYCSKSEFKLAVIDKDEQITSHLGNITKESPYHVLGDNDVHLIALYIDNPEKHYRYYSLIDIKNMSSQTVRVGEITIGSTKSGQGFISKTWRVKKDITRSHICAYDEHLVLISAKHAVIYYNDFGEFWIEDVGATNGLYVNDFLLLKDKDGIARKKLEYGDVIDLFTAKIIFCESYLQIEVLTGHANVSNLDEIIPFQLSSDDNAPILKLPPRKINKLPDEPIKMPQPPSENKNNQDFARMFRYILRPLQWLLLPLLGSGISNSSESTAAQVISMALYIVGPSMMVWQFMKRKKLAKKENIEKANRYKEKITKIVKILDQRKIEQNEIFGKTHTTAQDTIRRAVSVDWRLWERTAGAEDFMEIKLGQGIAKPSFDIEMPDEDSLEDKPQELKDLLLSAYDEHKEIYNYPITLSLLINPNVGLVGVYYSRMKALLSFIIQLSIHHSAEDLKIACIYPQNQRNDFEIIRFLPHVWMEDKSGRMMFTGDNRARTCEGECIEKPSTGKTCPQCYREYQFNEIIKIIEQREKLYDDNDTEEGMSFSPKYLFVISDISMVKGENTHDICNYLLNNFSHLGLYSICLGEQRTDIPANFTSIINTGFEKGVVSDNENNKYRFQLDLYKNSDIERVSRALAPIRIESLTTNKFVPSYIPLLDLFDAKTLEDLNIISRWKEQYQKTIPEAPVGKIDQKKLFTLNITRKGIGPHGIVGGTTGSGKSEFLLSVILGMAVNCHPHRLGMVILDYKGGSTAEACKDLPHVHGIVTDLDKGVMTKRALAAIKYEVEYRENVFRKYSNITGKRVEDLKSYIEIVKDGPIIPYLLVIVDELAELKIREPAAMDILEDIARRGRSVGIYLLLTTQNPQGVINNQIQANVNYRICFRISKDNSRGIIDSPDAAYISDKTPGRGLLRVGNNELISFQSAYTGAKYHLNTDEEEAQDIPNVYAVDIEGQRKPIFVQQKDSKNHKKVSQLNAVVDEVIRIAKVGRLKELNDFWLEPLPTKIVLTYIIGNTNFDGNKWRNKSSLNIRILAGLSDNIRDREYIPTIIDFDEEKAHLAIYGPSYSGKTTLLYTIIMSLAYQNSPEMLNMYLFDFSTSPSYIISQLPHVGNVFFGTNRDDVFEGRDMLLEELHRRAEKFSKKGVSNIKEYNVSVKDNEKMANIFIFIDNIDQMGDYPSKQVAGFEELLRTGISYGIYFVCTAPDKRTLNYDFRRYFDSHTICLWPEEVMGFDLPRHFSMTSRNQGRGFYNGYEFQAALPIDIEADESLNLVLLKTIENMASAYSGKQVLKSNSVSGAFSMDELQRNAPQKSDTNIPIGFDMKKREIMYYNMGESKNILMSHVDAAKATEKLTIIFNRLYENSNDFSKHKITIITRDTKWTEKIKDYKKFTIIKFSEDKKDEIEKFMINLARQMNKGYCNEMIVCDEWGELINISTNDTYSVMRFMFTDAATAGNARFILSASHVNINLWQEKGCPHIIEPMMDTNLLADGKTNDHSWQLIKSANDLEIDDNSCGYFENNSVTILRLK